MVLPTTVSAFVLGSIFVGEEPVVMQPDPRHILARFICDRKPCPQAGSYCLIPAHY